MIPEPAMVNVNVSEARGPFAACIPVAGRGKEYERSRRRIFSVCPRTNDSRNYVPARSRRFLLAMRLRNQADDAKSKPSKSSGQTVGTQSRIRQGSLLMRLLRHSERSIESAFRMLTAARPSRRNAVPSTGFLRSGEIIRREQPGMRASLESIE